LKRPARKRFGQNFLTDTAVIRRITDCISPRPGELIIEIGPGRAALTDALLESGASLVLVEIDRDLAGDLERRFPDSGAVEVHSADALQTDFATLAGKRPYRLVGNLPYNISTPLIFHILGMQRPPLDMHFMLQKEVVARMASGPGNKTYGRLSIMCQNLCEVTELFEVSPASFDPAPRVTSAVVRLVPRATPLSGHESLNALERVVRQAFSLRRKTLRNSLSTLLTAAELEASGVEPGQRAEQLDLANFFALARTLQRKVSSGQQ
jgi:16S rRNA (adenine1518-N6/adenine1519-N6)-dimethyltransferase